MDDATIETLRSRAALAGDTTDIFALALGGCPNAIATVRELAADYAYDHGAADYAQGITSAHRYIHNAAALEAYARGWDEAFDADA